MSLFKKLINAAVLDLRGYTPQALGKIRAINAAVIILPSDAGDEFYEAYAQITVNVASTLRLPENKKLAIHNGIGEITNFTDDVILSDGVTIVHKIDSDKPIEMITNGVVVYDPETKINFISNNGVTKKAPFALENVKSFPVSATLDADFFNYIDDYTIIVCGNQMKLSENVTVDVLRQKNIHLIAGNSIECSKAVISYVQTISTVGNKVKSYD